MVNVSHLLISEMGWLASLGAASISMGPPAGPSLIGGSRNTCARAHVYSLIVVADRTISLCAVQQPVHRNIDTAGPRRSRWIDAIAYTCARRAMPSSPLQGNRFVAHNGRSPRVSTMASIARTYYSRTIRLRIPRDRWTDHYAVCLAGRRRARALLVSQVHDGRTMCI